MQDSIDILAKVWASVDLEAFVVTDLPRLPVNFKPGFELKSLPLNLFDRLRLLRVDVKCTKHLAPSAIGELITRTLSVPVLNVRFRCRKGQVSVFNVLFQDCAAFIDRDTSVNVPLKVGSPFTATSSVRGDSPQHTYFVPCTITLYDFSPLVLRSNKSLRNRATVPSPGSPPQPAQLPRAPTAVSAQDAVQPAPGVQPAAPAAVAARQKNKKGKKKKGKKTRTTSGAVVEPPQRSMTPPTSTPMPAAATTSPTTLSRTEPSSSAAPSVDASPQLTALFDLCAAVCSLRAVGQLAQAAQVAKMIQLVFSTSTPEYLFTVRPQAPAVVSVTS